MWKKRKSLRLVSAFVLTSFVGSLASPALAAGASPASPATADAMTQVSSKALSDMWFLWNRHLQSFNGPKAALTPGYANQFFQQAGANTAQAEVLVNNARSQGQLTGGLAAASSSTSVMDKLKSLFRRTGTPKAAVPEAAAKSATDSAKAADAAKSAKAARDND